MKPSVMMVMLWLFVGGAILLRGCGDGEGYELIIEFPQTAPEYRDFAALLKIYVVVSPQNENACNDLISGVHTPHDDGYTIEDEEALTSPFTENVRQLKVVRQKTSSRQFFVEGENTKGDLILRGCTEVNPQGTDYRVTVSLAAACPVGTGNCDGDLSNGCERDITTLTDCGGCNAACTNENGGTSCTDGACVPSCGVGFNDCDGNPGNGCETDLTSASGCNGHAMSCSFSAGAMVCACSPAFDGANCDRCSTDAFGAFPHCFLPSQTYCLTNLCFPVPPTGQTSCYNASASIGCPGGHPPDCQNGTLDFCGQDAQYSKSRNFTCYGADGTVQSPCATSASDDGVVTDSVTGLMWQRTFIPNKNWQEAIDYCDGLDYGGYTDWRLPDVFELVSILDFSRYNPAVNITIFPGLPDTSANTGVNRFHASSTYASGTNTSWFADFYDGYVSNQVKTTVGLVRCVRLGRPSVSSGEGDRFFSSGTTEPVVSDVVTGLVWQSTSVTGSGGKSWNDALKYCESSGYGGFTDWRLPSVTELMSLLNHSRRNPASDFPEESSSTYWSSSTYARTPTNAWPISFFEGFFINSFSKTTNLAVRCVRGGP